jgi:hypothetical protein
LLAHIGTQSSDGIEELAAVSNNRDAEVFEVLRREARKDPLIYLVLAEAASFFPRPRLRS